MDDVEFARMKRLHRAAADNKPATVRKFLREGGDVELADEDGWTAMHRAALSGAAEVVRLLLDVGARPDPVTREGWAPLHGAIHQGHEEVVTMLLDAGTDLDCFGGEALFRALRRGELELLEDLLERGADPNAQDDFDCILVRAIMDGELGAVDALLRAGADPMGSHERGALWVALGRGRADIAGRLLDAGADPGLVDDRGASPLAMAAAMGDVASAARLIADPRGAALLERSDLGLTPLLEAAMAGQREMLDWLLERGSDLQARDPDGRSAHTLARLEDHGELVAHLEGLGLVAQAKFDAQVRDEAESRAKVEAKRVEMSEDFGEGRAGRVTAGPFSGFSGRAVPGSDGQLRVLIEIFGRPTEVQVEEEQFEAGVD